MRSVVVLLGLIGCSPVAAPPQVDPIPYRLDAGGIQLELSPLRIDFGRTQHSAISAMDKLAASGPIRQNGCGNGALAVIWPDGTSLIFQDGDFRGWATSNAAQGLACPL